MSIFSTLNANDLMTAARAKLQPDLDQIIASADSAEAKALAQLHIEVAVLTECFTQVTTTLVKGLEVLFDGYTVTIQISKKVQT